MGLYLVLGFAIVLHVSIVWCELAVCFGSQLKLAESSKQSQVDNYSANCYHLTFRLVTCCCLSPTSCYSTWDVHEIANHVSGTRTEGNP